MGTGAAGQGRGGAGWVGRDLGGNRGAATSHAGSGAPGCSSHRDVTGANGRSAPLPACVCACTRVPTTAVPLGRVRPVGTSSVLILPSLHTPARPPIALQVEGLLEGPKLQRKLDQERAAIQSLSLL